MQATGTASKPASSICDDFKTAGLHALGEARCRQARERRLSLTDCVSIEVMRRRNIRDFIGRDDHLEREGFRLA